MKCNMEKSPKLSLRIKIDSSVLAMNGSNVSAISWDRDSCGE